MQRGKGTSEKKENKSNKKENSVEISLAQIDRPPIIQTDVAD